MPREFKNRVSITDMMVMTAVLLSLVYCIILLLLFSFIKHPFGSDFVAISSCLIAICFFAILGSHAQYKINTIENTKAELMEELMEEKKQNEMIVKQLGQFNKA